MQYSQEYTPQVTKYYELYILGLGTLYLCRHTYATKVCASMKETLLTYFALGYLVSSQNQ